MLEEEHHILVQVVHNLLVQVVRNLHKVEEVEHRMVVVLDCKDRNLAWVRRILGIRS